MSFDDLREFKRTYGTSRNTDLAEKFGITRDAVARLAAQLCLGKDKKTFPVERMPRWSSEEVEILRSLYGGSDNAEIARGLRRTIKSVVAKAHNLGLKKNPERLAEMGRQNVRFRRDRQ